MKTQTVSALELLKHPLPIIVRGTRGVYEVTKIVAEGENVTCYTSDSQGNRKATLRKRFDAYFEVVVTEQKTDHLLDTIGALHTRNKSLQKGHASLTRRVQELEMELALEKHKQFVAEPQTTVRGRPFIDTPKTDGKNPQCHCLEKPLSDRAVDAIIADVLKPEHTAADQKLQADLKAVSHQVNGLEDALLIAFNPGHIPTMASLQLESAIVRGIRLVVKKGVIQ